jgi:hypothetical protein
MGEVNSPGENRPPETGGEPPRPAQGAQLPAENGAAPGLFRASQRAERVSPEGMLADGEDSNSRYLIG